MQHSSQSLDQQRFLFGEDGPQIEDEAIIFHAGDNGDASRARRSRCSSFVAE